MLASETAAEHAKPCVIPLERSSLTPWSCLDLNISGSGVVAAAARLAIPVESSGEGRCTGKRAEHEVSDARRHVYLREITVEGFRGIGRSASLQLEPTHGLSVVAGRNGSGKSSFAEALELALTNDSQRWAGKQSVWKQGWRNLHAPDPCAIEITLTVDGSATPASVTLPAGILDVPWPVTGGGHGSAGA